MLGHGSSMVEVPTSQHWKVCYTYRGSVNAHSGKWNNLGTIIVQLIMVTKSCGHNQAGNLQGWMSTLISKANLQSE